MAIPAETLAQLIQGSPQTNAGGGGGARQPMRQQQPAYQMLNRIGQQHADTPPNSDLVIPARYQEGGVADRGGYPEPARPIYDAKMLSRPPQYLSGYYGELGPTHEQVAYQQAMRAMMPQYARPIYTPQMLSRPPQHLSGYYGEMGGYQEGGIVDPETGRVRRNYAGEGAGSYYYVDPRASRAQEPNQRVAQQAAEMARILHTGVPYQSDFYPTDPATGDLTNRQYPTGYDEFGPTLDTILGPDYTRMKNEEAGRVPAGENPYGMQGGGVVYPSVQLDTAGLPTLGGAQAPQQQSSPSAGEPSKKKQQKGPVARPPQHYEFGPADFYYNAPSMKKMMEEQAAAERPQGMKEGGVIPKEFMQYLAGGGVTEFTPDHHLMFALGMAHGLSSSQAKKGLDKVSRPNPMPP